MSTVGWTVLRAIGIFELLLLSVIIIYHFYHLNKTINSTSRKQEKSERNETWIKSYNILTYLFVALSFIHSINLVLVQNNAYNISSNNGCYIRIYINSALHSTAKYVLYLLLITRLYSGYAGSKHEYSLKVVIIPCYCFITLWWIYSWLLNLSAFSWETEYNSSSISSCDFIPKNALFSSISLLWDVIITIILLTLFLKPLHKLVKNAAANDNLISIVIKITVLTSCIIISTYFAVIAYIFMNTLVVLLLNNILDISAILLMNNSNHIIYKKLCGNKCDKCCLCLCCCGYRKNIDLDEIYLMTSDNTSDINLPTVQSEEVQSEEDVSALAQKTPNVDTPNVQITESV